MTYSPQGDSKLINRSLGINSQALQAWHQAIAEIFDTGFDDDSIATVTNALEALVNSSGCALIVYPRESQPYWPYHHLLSGQDPAIHIDQYIQGAYLLDPYYRLAIERREEGVYTISDVAPTGFKQSEFYRVYYRQVNLCDEACLIIQAPDDCIILISLSRLNNEPRFSRSQKALLQAIFPTVKSIVMGWWRTQEQDKRENSLRSHLDTALANFGNSILTQRETEVLHLALRGYSVKAVAQRLDLSPETIKHYRKSIYTKLDIKSQPELFYLFIDSLRTVTPDSPADPLVNYMSQPSSAS